MLVSEGYGYAAIPALGDDLRLAIYVNLPAGTHDVTPARAAFHGGAYTERRTIRRGGGLTGQTIAIEGLSGTSTDVLVRIESLGGATQTERLSPTKTTFVVQTAPGAGEVAATYLRLGIEPYIKLLFPAVCFFSDITHAGHLDMPSYGWPTVDVIAVQEFGLGMQMVI